MTHPIYSQTTLEALTVKELKTIASQIGAISDGDKRAKQTWVSAIIDHQIMFSPAKVEAMEAHIAEVMSRLESVTPDAPELPTMMVESPAQLDTYIPTPPTHADDVAFAAAMGLTYDDVFGEPLSPPDAPVTASTAPMCESTPQPAPQPPTSNQRRGASIVAVVIATMLSALLTVMGIGIKALIPVIAAVGQLTVAVWRYLVQSPIELGSIDYSTVTA